MVDVMKLDSSWLALRGAPARSASVIVAAILLSIVKPVGVALTKHYMCMQNVGLCLAHAADRPGRVVQIIQGISRFC
jgi:hypothetical protein